MMMYEWAEHEANRPVCLMAVQLIWPYFFTADDDDDDDDELEFNDASTLLGH